MTDGVTWLKISEYAAHRRVSRPAIYKAKDSGRLPPEVFNAEGKINRDAADAALDRNTDAGRRRSIGPQKKTCAERVLAAHQASKEEAAVASYQEHRAKREAYQADIARLELEKLEGKLVPADEVEDRWTKILTATRNALIGIPVKMRVLAPGVSAVELQVLEELIREILNELADDDAAAKKEGAA